MHLNIKSKLAATHGILIGVLLCQIGNTAAEDAAAGPSPFWLAATNHVGHNEKLDRILNRVGPNMRASSDYHDYADIQLNESIEAWRLLHDQSEQFAHDQVHFYKPKIKKLLKNAKVSAACQDAAEFVFDSMQQLDSWPVQMWSSTGNFPPVGLLDGQFSDMGSYRGCVDMSILPLSTVYSNSSGNDRIGFTAYCSVAFRPIVPSRPRFHQIFEEVPERLTNIFNQTDIFSKILHRAQFFHYIYMKTGICVPYQCSATDIQQIARILGRRMALMPGPVKCFTRAPLQIMAGSDSTATNELAAFEQSGFTDSIESQPILVRIEPPMNLKQVLAAITIASFFGLVLVTTLWHAAERLLSPAVLIAVVDDYKLDEDHQGIQISHSRKQHPESKKAEEKPIEYKGLKHVAFDYFSLITSTNDYLDTSMRPTEIKCLHGFKVVTMSWIIIVHTFQYNEWSEFTRIFEIVSTLQNPALHPVYNANYVVDNFFFMSGLLVAYTAWLSSKGEVSNFNIIASLIGRYLRLTPQVFLIALLYILLPLLGDSPFWFDMTHHASKSCERNWWISLLHLQSFYKEQEICNLVSWWISVDMLYYVIAIALIYMILNKQQNRALIAAILFVGLCMIMSAYRHYTGSYSPNNLGTVPQIGEVWSSYVLCFFWSPYPHAYPFYFGFWVGYALATKKWRRQVKQWSRFGWALAVLSMLIISMSSHIWMSGAIKLSNQSILTAYNNICIVVWITAFAWIVVACHYGCAPTLNKLLSCELFVLLSKSSYIIYLSHMLVLRVYFGLQNTILGLSVITLLYAIIGNTFVSTMFGVFLCISFEGPCMKLQKFVVQKLKSKGHLPIADVNNTANDGLYRATNGAEEKADLTSNVLFK